MPPKSHVARVCGEPLIQFALLLGRYRPTEPCNDEFCRALKVFHMPL